MIRTFCLGFFIFHISILCAQSGWGIKTGPNISSLGKTGNGFKPQLGYHLGGYRAVPFAENVKLQIELIYSLQGARDELIAELNHKYHYLNLPVLLGLKIFDEIDLQLGQQTGFLLKGVRKDPLVNLNITDNLKKIDVGLLLGLAINLNKTVNVYIRYIQGLNNTVKASPSSDIKFQNKVWQLSVAISI